MTPSDDAVDDDDDDDDDGDCIKWLVMEVEDELLSAKIEALENNNVSRLERSCCYDNNNNNNVDAAAAASDDAVDDDDRGSCNK